MIALLCGFLFGCGLTIASMIDPNKIQNFLDITGDWDPSLALVMVSALCVTWVGYQLILKKQHPMCSQHFILPTKTNIDKSLIIGSALFGIGWGAAGYCPGPAITALGLGIMDAAYFVIGMLLSVLTYRLLAKYI